jgi:hypothetical protein
VPPEPPPPAGPLASAPDEHVVVEVVVEAVDPLAALVVVVLDFAVPPGLVVVEVALEDEHAVPPAPKAWAPVPPTLLDPPAPAEPWRIGLWAAASMADCESRLPHPANSRATLASARAATEDRRPDGRVRRVASGVPSVRPAPR